MKEKLNKLPQAAGIAILVVCIFGRRGAGKQQRAAFRHARGE